LDASVAAANSGRRLRICVCIFAGRGWSRFILQEYGELKPLDEIVVLDLTRLLPGAVATQILGDFGAEVIKIEAPPKGDPGRYLVPLVEGQSTIFGLTNGGKKSASIHLKDARGKRAFLRLVERADILVEGFRPGVMERLGLSYAELAAVNPRLIYAAISGFGQSGPRALVPAHDINYIAAAGLFDLMRARDGSPIIPPVLLADIAGGAMQAVIGILLALAARAKSGRGQMVDVSMVDGLAPLLIVPRGIQMAEKTRQAGGGLLVGAYACYNVYQARDGEWLAVGALEPKFWEELCRVMRCEEFAGTQYADGGRQTAMIVRLSEIFRTRDAREWAELLVDACVTFVEKLPDRELAVVPGLSESPGERSRRVPRIGEHTREVLLRSGIGEDEIREMEISGAVCA
jgi:crotonobetainyl-CoA:carnitine CoA-transferase CaiB-like acyl-CoA transferase